jgi:uncharacterized protein (TIGR00299 family) protein
MTELQEGPVHRIDLNPIGGVAGDMFCAALIDAFPSLREVVALDIAALGIDGLGMAVEPTVSADMRAAHFVVSQPEQPKPPRTPAQVNQFLADSALNDEAQRVAAAIYDLLAHAEAEVHGKTIETIHFHEVSDWDSMVDIVSAAAIISRLPAVTWRLGPLPLGGGMAKTAHGQIAVPAPATVQLLKGFEWVDDGLAGERVTPTGAAILRYLSPDPLASSAMPATLVAVGSGAGTRQLHGRANVLRATAFSHVSADTEEQITELAFEVDDMTGEEIAAACDALRNEAGVLDVSTVIMHGKKNRTATGFRLLARPETAPAVTSACFRQTSTLGVRHTEMARTVLPREEHDSDGMPVKLAWRPGSVVTAKAASDELAGAADLQARRQRAQQAEDQARQASADSPGRGNDN